VKANSEGVIETTIIHSFLDIYDIIGRSMIIHADKDDLGRGKNKDSLITGNSGKRVLCGVLGLSEDTCT
jgi:Cu/Zn superoxide dismutase